MKRPCHVLQVVHSMHVSGAERLVKDLDRHFNDGEYRTSLCCLDSLGEFGEELRQAGIDVDVLGRRPGLDAGLVGRLGLYRERGVDVAHTPQHTPCFYAATACRLVAGPRVVFTDHGRHQPDRVRIRRIVYDQLLRDVTGAYTAASEFTRDSLTRFERIPRSRIRVIYNGVALGDQRPADREAAARQSLSLDPKGASC